MNLKILLYNQYLTYKYISGNVKKYRSGDEKSKIDITKDLYKWQISECEFNHMYYAMGLNIKGTEQDEYIGRKTFLKIKTKVESKLKTQAGIQNLNYDVITKDKFYLSSILSQNSIPCAENMGVIIRGELILSNGFTTPLEKIKDIGEDFVLKKNTLDAGEGIFVCKIQGDKVIINDSLLGIDEFREKLGDSVWIIQKKYNSHYSIQRINSSALNTTRIVTILQNFQPEYLTGFQGFAVNNAKIDSWYYGSIYVGIKPYENKLKADGITSPYDKKEGILTFHPDSKIEFNNYFIPFLKDAVDLCKKAHKFLYANFIIGWDVAITEEGPLIIEANEKPGMNVVQCLDGGLKKKILQIANEYM